MTKYILSFVILFVLLQSAAASLLFYNPEKIPVRDIFVGVILKTSDGEIIEDGRATVVAQRVSAYLASELNVYNVEKIVRLETFFPWGCNFYDARISRYRPESDRRRGSRELDLVDTPTADLNIMIVHTIDGRKSENTSIEFCLSRPGTLIAESTGVLEWPDGYPEPDFDRAFLEAVPEALNEKILYRATPYLDAIAYGMGRLENEEPE